MSSLTVEMIRPLVERHGVKTFVESGCYRGDGIQTALDSGIKKVFSCDVWPDNVDKCKERFKSQPSVEILHCKGFDMIDCLDIKNKCLFWLDGHLPGHYGYTVNDPWQFDLIKELEILNSLDECNHVILCDDAWLFKDHPDYEKSPEFYRQEITCKQIYDMFPDHKGTLISVEQGIVLLEPI